MPQGPSDSPVPTKMKVSKYYLIKLWFSRSGKEVLIKDTKNINWGSQSGKETLLICWIKGRVCYAPNSTPATRNLETKRVMNYLDFYKGSRHI